MIDVTSGRAPLLRRRSAGLVIAATLTALLFGLAAEASPAQAASLRYFGYFAARITPAGGDHLPEVAGRSNLNWVQISDPDRYRPEVLDHCAAAGCLISTGNEFFRNCTGTHNPDCELYPNYAERWSRLAEAVRSRIEKVGAFYLMDEPQYRGATRAELETAAATIKATYPTIPVMMVEAGPQVTSSLQLPAEVDWVGFDWYCQPFATIEEKLTILTGKISAAQSLFLVPESAPLAACGGHASDAEIASLQYRYYDLALRNPRVIGLLAFGLWTSGYGSGQLPLTVAAHQDIFAAILAANQPPPGPAPPASPPAVSPPPPPPRPDRVVRIRGEEARIDAAGVVTLRLRCPAANAGSCAGSVSLRRAGRAPAARKKLPLGKRRFAIAPGHTRKVPVEIDHGRHQLLKLARRHDGVWLRAIATTAAGKTVKKLRAARRPLAGVG